MIIDDWEPKGLLVTRYIGNISGDELIQSALAKSGDIRFDKVRFIVGDWTEAKKVSIQPNDVKALVACLRPISQIIPNAKSCSIVNRDSTGNALLAWYKYLTEDISWAVEIMHSREEAAEWCPLYKLYLKENAEILACHTFPEDFDDQYNDDFF